ncbi:hypothetical protein [Pseudomonas baetica]|uniref:hypothetical protein n=1 Tax=Pseudomonas baetica TaxID=674054 RepID=UPI00240708C1|nr:hypothetical protein [Pseudomonas baetica]MDF9778961.1 hypothetical protein [Pseudomonas baetica]
MNDREKVACGQVVAANTPAGDPVSRDRGPRILAVVLLVVVTVRFAVGGAVFEQIWIGLTAVIVGGMVLMATGILGLWICFGEARLGAWLSAAHRRNQSIAFVCCVLTSAACYYHYYDYVR